MSEANAITVDVVSDVVCPWCFIGQKRLDKGVAAAGDVEVHIRWRPFQLDPTIPPQGKDRHEYMLAKFGSDERIREIHARIEPLGEAEGISFAFDAIKVAPNTLDAHRL
ncbi:MAG: DsbA family protein, partial [Mesorhizobium sp.]